MKPALRTFNDHRPDFKFLERMSLEAGKTRTIARGQAYGISAEVALGRIGKTELQIAAALPLCESPIERVMLPALAFACYAEKFASFPAEVHSPKNGSPPPLGDLVVIPQFAFIRYRLDFGVIGSFGGRYIIAAVECDGEEFHSDADKDHRRDAYLKAFGITVFHFSGSDIVKDPCLCASQVAQFVASWRETIA